MTTIEILKDCTIDGNIVKLPSVKLDRDQYLEVAKKLQDIGGKWKGAKVQGFVFDFNPTDLLSQIQSGENRNLKKEFQLFETPEELAADLVEHAYVNAKIFGKTLEPSAGRGAIIKAIHKYEFEYINVRYCELNPLNRPFLDQIPNTEFIAEDFLSINMPNEFATIIANPPFAKNQDIDHIYKMYECLKPQGRLVSIASMHWQLCSNKKETEFKNWLNQLNTKIIDVDRGAFKKSGTTIATCIIVIDK